MTVTLPNKQSVDVTPDNAQAVADQYVAAQRQVDQAANRASDPALESAQRAAVINAANGTGGSVSGVDVPDLQYPVDYIAVIGDTFTRVGDSFSVGAATIKKNVADNLPSSTWLKVGVVVVGLVAAAYIVSKI